MDETSQVLKPPSLLLVQLKRFLSTTEKNHANVKKLKSFYLKTSEGQFCYELIGALEHIGSSLSSGHYVTFAHGLDNKIYKFDDDEIFLSNLDDINGRKAYICLYRLNNLSEVDKIQEKVDVLFDKAESNVLFQTTSSKAKKRPVQIDKVSKIS